MGVDQGDVFAVVEVGLSSRATFADIDGTFLETRSKPGSLSKYLLTHLETRETHETRVSLLLRPMPERGEKA